MSARKGSRMHETIHEIVCEAGHVEGWSGDKKHHPSQEIARRCEVCGAGLIAKCPPGCVGPSPQPAPAASGDGYDYGDVNAVATMAVVNDAMWKDAVAKARELGFHNDDGAARAIFYAMAWKYRLDAARRDGQ